MTETFLERLAAPSKRHYQDLPTLPAGEPRDPQSPPLDTTTARLLAAPTRTRTLEARVADVHGVSGAGVAFTEAERETRARLEPESLPTPSKPSSWKTRAFKMQFGGDFDLDFGVLAWSYMKIRAYDLFGDAMQAQPTREQMVNPRRAQYQPTREQYACRPYRATSQWAVEPEAPASYVGAPLEGRFEFKPFAVEIIKIEFLRSGDLDRFGWPVMVASGMKRCRVELRVQDRTDPSAKIPLYASETFPIDHPDAVCAREILLAFMRHELEECIHVNGVRVWDPHVGRPNGI